MALNVGYFLAHHDVTALTGEGASSHAATGTVLTEEGREFLQGRVARFGLVAGVGSIAFWLYRSIKIVVDGGQGFADPSFWWHLAGAALLAAPWVLCRGTPRSAKFVQRVESAGLVAASASYAVMGAYIPLWNSPGLVMVLALSLATVARAAYVPSTARRTLVLGLIIGVPVVGATYAAYLDFDPAQWRLVDAQLGAVTPTRVAIMQSTFATAWWLSMVAVCTLASSVTFGLRKEVRDVRRLGQYAVGRKLGEGGMGIVYRARHAMLQRPTAIKILNPEKVGEHSIARFEREVRLTAQLSHPNTVTIFDYGRTPDGLFYYAMELLDGVSLDELVALDGAEPAGRVVSLLRQAAGHWPKPTVSAWSIATSSPATSCSASVAALQTSSRLSTSAWSKSSVGTTWRPSPAPTSSPELRSTWRPKRSSLQMALMVEAISTRLAPSATSWSPDSMCSKAGRMSRCAAITFTRSRLHRRNAWDARSPSISKR